MYLLYIRYTLYIAVLVWLANWLAQDGLVWVGLGSGWAWLELGLARVGLGSGLACSGWAGIRWLGLARVNSNRYTVYCGTAFLGQHCWTFLSTSPRGARTSWNLYLYYDFQYQKLIKNLPQRNKYYLKTNTKIKIYKCV